MFPKGLGSYSSDDRAAVEKRRYEILPHFPSLELLNWWLCPKLFSARGKNSSLHATLILLTSSLQSLLLQFVKKGVFTDEMSQNYESSEQTHVKKGDNVFVEIASIV